MTSEGHPGARLQRALAAGNLTAAEQAAFEVPFISLEQARALVELYAEKGDSKYERAALKYLRRYLDESEPSLVDVAQVAGLLADGRYSCAGCSGRVRMQPLASGREPRGRSGRITRARPRARRTLRTARRS
jgi:hypothetical protein